MVLVVSFCVALGAGASLQPDDASRTVHAQNDPGCSVTPYKSASPTRVSLGEQVTVTLRLDGDCPSTEKKADVVLVIDRSSSMGRDNKFDDAKAAATAFVDQMNATLVQVGVVAFDDVVSDVQPLTADKALLRQAIAGLTMDRGTNLVDSLDRGRRMVLGIGSRPDAQPVIVFMTDGNHSVTAPPLGALDTVIDGVRAAGIDTFAIGLGNDADDVVLRRIASDPSKYYTSIGGTQLADIYRQIAGRIEAASVFQTLTIQDVVPANMRYIVGSAAPAATWDATARTVTWTFNQVPKPGVVLTFRVEPTESGTHPTNVSARAVYRDGFGNEGETAFPVPEVIVEPPVGVCVCRITRLRAPAHVISAALANPERILGWRDPLNPNLRPGELPNPRRLCLDLRNRNISWHPLFNRVVWRAGCLIGPDIP